MDRSLRERAEFLPAADQADLLILFENQSTGFRAPGDLDADMCKAKITVVCGEGNHGDLNCDLHCDLRCGLSTDCDLTFSSLQKGRLQICLLHAVTCLDGHVCEPFEFPFRGSVGNAYPLLAAAAVKILCEIR